MKLRFSYFLLFIFTLISSCKLIGSIITMNKNDRKPIKIENCLGKDVVYMPIHHFGKKKFYSNLKNKISSYQEEGYVVYYEGVYINTKDSTERNNIILKFRKLSGFLPSRKQYNQLKAIFPNKIPQPSMKQLGANNKSFNVDMSMDSLVYKYENEYGLIKLDSIDYNTHIDSLYIGEPMQNFNIVKHKWREEKIFSNIFNSTEEKILLVFGKKHKKRIKTKFKDYCKTKS